MTETILDRRRDEFPTLASGIHLLSHSLGPVPRATRAALLAFYEAWEGHTSEDAWATSWWGLSEEIGDLIAGVLGAAPGSVQVQANASTALATVASCFDIAHSDRKKVVTTALDFPSMGYIWDGQRALGAEIVVVPSDDGVSVPLERILDALDESTLLVAMAHTSYRSSFRVDAKAIVERAHAVGALVLLDVYQSAGVVELDASGWEVDFLIGGSIKWLCGGPSSGYLYVRPDLHALLRPRLTGWIAHAEPFAFSHEEMVYTPSVRRFAQGTPNVPGLHAFREGLRIITEVGVPAIAAESRRRTTRMIEFACAHGLSLRSPVETDRRGGSVMIGVDDPADAVKKLAMRGVFVDCRPGVGIRMSPHFFNTDDEVDRALETVADVLR